MSEPWESISSHEDKQEHREHLEAEQHCRRPEEVLSPGDEAILNECTVIEQNHVPCLGPELPVARTKVDREYDRLVCKLRSLLSPCLDLNHSWEVGQRRDGNCPVEEERIADAVCDACAAMGRSISLDYWNQLSKAGRLHWLGKAIRFRERSRLKAKALPNLDPIAEFQEFCAKEMLRHEQHATALNSETFTYEDNGVPNYYPQALGAWTEADNRFPHLTFPMPSRETAMSLKEYHRLLESYLQLIKQSVTNNPYRDLLNLALGAFRKELTRTSQWFDSREDLKVLEPRLRAVETLSIRLVIRCLSQSCRDRIGYPQVDKIKEWVTSLRDATQRIMLWQARTPCLDSEERRTIGYRGGRNPVTAYFNENWTVIVAAVKEIEILAGLFDESTAAEQSIPFRSDDGAVGKPDSSVGIMSPEHHQLVLNENGKNTSEAPCDKSSKPTRTAINFSQWGIGFDPTTGWHVFRLTREGWKIAYDKKKLVVPSGVVSHMLVALLDGKGNLYKRDILRFYPNAADQPRKLNSYLTRLRRVISKRIGLNDGKPNVLPKVRGEAHWRLEIRIGQAEKVDLEYSGADPELKFLPCE